MDVEDLFDLDNILFRQRKCRSCKQTKDLITDFYRSRPNRQAMSAYSYECKECTKKELNPAETQIVENPGILTGSMFVHCFPT